MGETAKRSKVSYRELDVLTLVGMGFSADEIAKQMGISVQTVKNHYSNLQKKLGTKNKAQTLLTAIKQGMIRVEFGLGDHGEIPPAPFGYRIDTYGYRKNTE